MSNNLDLTFPASELVAFEIGISFARILQDPIANPPRPYSTKALGESTTARRRYKFTNLSSGFIKALF